MKPATRFRRAVLRDRRREHQAAQPLARPSWSSYRRACHALAELIYATTCLDALTQSDLDAYENELVRELSHHLWGVVPLGHPDPTIITRLRALQTKYDVRALETAQAVYAITEGRAPGALSSHGETRVPTPGLGATDTVASDLEPEPTGP